MFNMKLMRILGSCLFLFILGFSFTNGVDAETPIRYLYSGDNYDVYDNFQDDEYQKIHVRMDWKGVKHGIEVTDYNLTPEELEPLFIKRDSLIEEIANLETMIKKINSSGNKDDENLNSDLKEKKAELAEFYEKYDFLKWFGENEGIPDKEPRINDLENSSNNLQNVLANMENIEDDSENISNVSAEMKNTGMTYSSLALLFSLFLSYFLRVKVKRKF